MAAWQVLGLILVGIVCLFFIGQLVRRPGQIIWMVARSLLLGVVGLFLLNLVGNMIHLHIALNPMNAAVVGFLGVPGTAALILMKMWILV